MTTDTFCQRNQGKTVDQMQLAVATVAGVNLFTRAVDGWRALPRGANGMQSLALAPWQLPELLQVTAAAGDVVPLELTEELPPPETGSGARGTAVAIPVVPELC